MCNDQSNAIVGCNSTTSYDMSEQLVADSIKAPTNEPTKDPIAPTDEPTGQPVADPTEDLVDWTESPSNIAGESLEPFPA